MFELSERKVSHFFRESRKKTLQFSLFLRILKLPRSLNLSLMSKMQYVVDKNKENQMHLSPLHTTICKCRNNGVADKRNNEWNRQIT